MKVKSTHALRYGSYSLIVTAIVLVVIILLNLGMGMLPASYTTIAADPQGIYDISSVSRSFMKKLDADITVYVVATEAQTDNTYLWIKEYVRRYSDLSDKVKVKTVDPAIYPNFLGSYTTEAVSAAQTHLVIVNEDTGRSRFVPYSKIVYEELDPDCATWTEQELYYYYYTYGTLPTVSCFGAEDALLSAIEYVTLPKLPVIYYTAGHGESTISSKLSGYLDQENITLTTLALTEDGKVPSDADAILIYAPTKDFTETEITALRNFAGKGGHVVLLSSYNTQLTDRKLPNLHGFAAEYGLNYQDVLVLEGNKSHYSGNALNILPQLTDHPYAEVVGNTYLAMPNAHGITVSESLPQGVTVTQLMTTTTSGYAKTEIKSDTKIEKEAGDLEGKFLLGAMGQKKVSGATSSFFWFSSSYLLNDQSVSYYSNYAYMIELLSDLCGKEPTVTVGAKLLQVEALSLSDGSAKVWGILLIGVIPGVTLLCGFVTWYRRSRR